MAGRLARLDTYWAQSSVAIVSAHGDIDGTNAHALTEHTFAYLAHCRGLILDLTRLEFFGAAGLLALHRISEACAGAGLGWAVVPGAAVSRLLRVCDPGRLLPAAATASAAVAGLQSVQPETDLPAQCRSLQASMTRSVIDASAFLR
jgi:anti-anti-sigma factor